MIGMRAPSLAEQFGTESSYEDAGADMRLGDLLRGERATLGKSLLDVQRELRIRASFVAAIENCDVSAFDAPSFIAGYVRSYARYLGMDADWVFRRFCEESGFQPVHGMAPAAAGPKPQRRPADPAEALANPRALFIPQPEPFWSSVEPRAVGSILVMLLLAGGLGYGGWSVLQEVQRVNLTPSEQAPTVVAAIDPAQEAVRVEPDQTGAVTLPKPEALDRVYRPQPLDVPVLTPRDTPIASIDPGLTPAETKTAPAEVPASQDASVASQPTAAAIGPDQPAPAEVRTVVADVPGVTVIAARPAWVRVSAADGSVILEKTMDAGERFALPRFEKPAVLRTGNSGAVYFAVNGQTYGPAAAGAQVVKNVELSAAAVQGKYAVADLSKDPELANIVAVASAAPLTQAPAAESAPIAGQ